MLWGTRLGGDGRGGGLELLQSWPSAVERVAISIGLCTIAGYSPYYIDLLRTHVLGGPIWAQRMTLPRCSAHQSARVF